jgi:hypothetical protein
VCKSQSLEQTNDLHMHTFSQFFLTRSSTTTGGNCTGERKDSSCRVLMDSVVLALVKSSTDHLDSAMTRKFLLLFSLSTDDSSKLLRLAARVLF